MAAATADIEAGLRRVLALRPEVRFACLFGSAVTRGPELARDIDVAASFRTSPSLLELGELEGYLERAIGRTVDLVDLDQATTLLRWEVARTGFALCSPDAVAWLEFRARAPIEYFDLQPYREREARGLRRALGARP
jgi:predicted nucleotidyltransferase